jgi:pimeloyl-ACP methyl ester carboxylesterase
MPKTVPPSDFTTADATFITNAMPDPFDRRDLPYRPRLEPLPSFIDPPVGPGRYVLTQEGESCTGHALATTINSALASAHAKGPTNGKSAKGRRTAPARVSPYMLYHFARRYDEFPGEADSGSSLRATIKGWFYHGVCTEGLWPRANKGPKDIYARDFVRNCRERPLGAFYRVNCYRLDDMQSAISELHAVVASAQIHGGWRHPQPYTKNGQTFHVIGSRNAQAEATGHAFAIVGYNEIGFVIQNSWGPGWGDGGFAVLTYEDWLDSAYDAWVLRHGVPSTPFISGRRRDEEATNSILATGVGPNRRRLDRHVVSLAGDGRLASTGDFVSTEQQLDRIFSCMQEWQDGWSEARRGGGDRPGSKVARHIVLYAQDGMRPKLASLEAADRPLNWWLNNRVYPIYLSWESGPAETLLKDLEQRMAHSLPPGGAGFDLVEQCDRLVELTARRHRRWMWDQLKQNARAAGGATAGADDASGAGLIAARLADYVGRHQGECAVHLVGHSAGAMVLAELLPLLQGRGIPVASLVLLAPAIRVDEFERLLAPLGRRSIEQFALFSLSEERELNDTCRGMDVDFYQKSLLYLVSRGLEDRRTGTPGAAEIPLLGMAKYFKKRDLQNRIEEKFRAAVFATAPTTEVPGASTEAEHHCDFEDDAATMTSVVTRLLQGAPVDPFRANAPLHGFDHVPGQQPTSTTTSMDVADTQPPGEPPVHTVKEGQPRSPRVPGCAGGGDPPAAGAAAPSGDRTTIGLAMAGWEPVLAKRPTGPTRRRTHA